MGFGFIADPFAEVALAVGFAPAATAAAPGDAPHSAIHPASAMAASGRYTAAAGVMAVLPAWRTAGCGPAAPRSAPRVSPASGTGAQPAARRRRTRPGS